MPVLATTVLVGIIAIAAVGMTRAQGRSAQQDSDWSTAQLQAQNAIEGGLYVIHANENWRDMLGSFNGTLGFYIGGGIATVVVTDPADGDIADSPDDDALLTATGTQGSAKHKTQVTLEIIHEPLEALATCLHAGGEIEVRGGCFLTVQDAPLSTNGNLKIDQVVVGDAEGLTRSGAGIITGTTTLGADPKDFPDPSVIDDYISKAVAIGDPGGTIEKLVLSPGANPWGIVDAEGVYFIDTGGSDLTIKGMRLWGTLIIRTGGKKVTIDIAAFMEPFRSDYPVLIVDGNLQIKTNGAPLSEPNWSTNFNPPAAPYLGAGDADIHDTYPNELRGLIHVTGTFEMDNSPVLNGAVICESNVVCHSSNSLIVHDPSLVTNPPEGYTTRKVQIAPGSWRQAVD